ncbi:VC2046/SO_2500 family protein [Shewanella sp. A32]|uniref:VC2046/SO_2500 family protein n=1 Tax=Shewanella sp. A32 TaxID=3031327 RepID=UPI0023B9F5E7|nr:VC2046/SO_2500 family protein [Shewanella sp. A32]MDF0535913.1 VC2046/SO_2500 family protein [Shewanella sp. A32]
MQSKPILHNELQLGSRLNRAIETNSRSDFGLLLSLLSQDVRDCPQFHLQDELDNDTQLRQQFELPPAPTLLGDLSQQLVTDNSAQFLSEGPTAFRLAEAINAEPIVIRGHWASGTGEVLENCSLLARNRFNGEHFPLLPETPQLSELVLQQCLAAHRLQAA